LPLVWHVLPSGLRCLFFFSARGFSPALLQKRKKKKDIPLENREHAVAICQDIKQQLGVQTGEIKLELEMKNILLMANHIIVFLSYAQTNKYHECIHRQNAIWGQAAQFT
jgi:hypothetical protein